MRNSWQANRQAFILYVIAEAGQPDAGRTSVLFESREKLGHYGRAYLALTFHLIDPSERARIETLLSDAMTEAENILTEMRSGLKKPIAAQPPKPKQIIREVASKPSPQAGKSVPLR